MGIKRNEPCPCGSGKKYKKCCQNKAVEINPETGEVTPEGLPTWKLVLIGLVILVVVSVGIGLIHARAGQIIGGIGGIGLLMWAAFRKPPPERDDAGDGAAINFGNK